MSLQDNKYAKTYTSFSGVDIVATFADIVIGEVQGISYSVSREKAPLYTMGSADPRGFSRGKRGISGSMVFQTWDRSALISRLSADAKGFMAYTKEKELYANKEVSTLDTVGEDVTGNLSATALNKAYTSAWYADQIPPFDVVLQAANEYGHTARMEIRGIEVLNTGSGMSIDDITTDESHTYVARAIKPWFKQRTWKGSSYELPTETR